MMYGSHWFSTLFVYSFPIPSVFKLWDILFLEDRLFLLKLSVAIVLELSSLPFPPPPPSSSLVQPLIMFIQKGDLLRLDLFEELIEHFKNAPSQLKIDNLIQTAKSVSIPAFTLEENYSRT